MKYPFMRFVYRILLRVAPDSLRSSHGQEMERLFTETLEIETRRRGFFGRIFVLYGAAADIFSWILSMRMDTAGSIRLGRNRVGRPEGRFTGFLKDFVYSIRALRKCPGYTAVALLTLALGLGGSIAIFSVVDGVLLRPLPYPDPGKLYTVWESNLELGRARSAVAPPTFFDWRQQAESFTEMSALSSSSATLTGGAAPERISAIAASPNIFELLGVQMLEGGAFPPEAEQPDGSRWVVVSFEFWQRWYGGDPQAVGSTLELDDEIHTVAGVLPEAFRFPETADLWIPLTFGPGQLTDGMRGARYLEVIARIRSDVTVDRALAEMTRISGALGEIHANNSGWSVTLVGLHENMVSEFRRSLTLLFIATILVLVIACVNLVNLVLVRSSERRHERAIRLALGATEGSLFRQSLVEHVILAVTGGLIGSLIASWSVPPLVRLAPAEIPRLEDVAIDARVLIVCIALSILVGLILSVVSTWTSVDSDPSHSLRPAQVGGTRTRHRVRRLLIVAEVAMSLVLLIGAGLLLRSFVRLQRVDPGFSSSGITTVSLSLPASRYGASLQKASFYREIIERLSERREVLAIGATTNLPLSGSAMRFGFGIDERPEASLNEQLSAEYHAVTPGYFRTMGIGLRSGRVLDWRDDAVGDPVVLINESMARRYWPDDNPVGKRITVVSQTGPESREIVGVVSDVRHAGLATIPRVEVYVPLSQDPWAFLTIVVRASGGTQIAQLVRAELAALDAGLPIGAVVPIERLVSRWLAPLRFQTVLVGLFAVTALLLATLGIYGVVSYIVSLRTREIGVRMALGALSHQVFVSVVGQGVWLAGAGLVLGIAVATLATRYLSSLLFEVSPIDPIVFLSVPGLVLCMAIVACYVPARRALKVDPVTALREM